MDKTLKTKDVEHKTQKKEMQAQALQEKKSDLAGTQKELDAAMKYYEKLKPTCIWGLGELRRPRGAAQGGNRVAARGAPHLQRGGHRPPAEGLTTAPACTRASSDRRPGTQGPGPSPRV